MGSSETTVLRTAYDRAASVKLHKRRARNVAVLSFDPQTKPGAQVRGGDCSYRPGGARSETGGGAGPGTHPEPRPVCTE